MNCLSLDEIIEKEIIDNLQIKRERYTCWQ
jgi:hypothetical protein